jgi:hypothetical protein
MFNLLVSGMAAFNQVIAFAAALFCVLVGALLIAFSVRA